MLVSSLLGIRRAISGLVSLVMVSACTMGVDTTPGAKQALNASAASPALVLGIQSTAGMLTFEGKGPSSAVQVVMVNASLATVTGISVALQGNNPDKFEIINNGCGQSLASSLFCILYVRLKDGTPGQYQATLTAVSAPTVTSTTLYLVGSIPVASANGCAQSGTVEDFSATMIGCTGTVSWANRDTLCNGGWHTCSSAEFVSRRGSLVPVYQYWTSDDLKYNGSYGNCFVNPTSGNECGISPMRIAATASDPLGNRVNWPGCGLNDVSDNPYFGGCLTNDAAGSVCCSD